jgi:hypothetical protein
MKIEVILKAFLHIFTLFNKLIEVTKFANTKNLLT